jgi:hypothetical protein
LSQLVVYNKLKEQLSLIQGIKHVTLYNNQLQRENVENPFLCPACLIEFNNENFKVLTDGVQQFDSIITVHLIFESYKDEDTFILQLKQDVYKVAHTLQCGVSASKLLRVAERQDFDHDNVQDYQTDYKTTIKDADASPTYINKTATLTLTPSITTS